MNLNTCPVKFSVDKLDLMKDVKLRLDIRQRIVIELNLYHNLYV